MTMPELTSWYPGRPARWKRRFLAAPDVLAELDKTFWSPSAGETREHMIRRRWELYALIKDWCDGEYIAPGDDLKPLDPWFSGCFEASFDGVWEFRTSKYRPRARLLGMISSRNTFIAFGLHLRDFLGRGRSSAWKEAAEAVRSRWESFFGARVPLRFRGTEFDDQEARDFWDEYDL